MNNPSSKGRTNSYFDSSERDKDTDFTEVLGIEEELGDLKKKLGENMTENQKEFHKKSKVLMEYRTNLFMSHMKSINEIGYVDLNVYILYNSIFIEKFNEFL
jgi:hypothetical protein